MTTIYVYKEETTFGPFFSSIDKVREYLVNLDNFDPEDMPPERIDRILTCLNLDDIGILKVELDNTSVDMIFDG